MAASKTKIASITAVLTATAAGAQSPAVNPAGPGRTATEPVITIDGESYASWDEYASSKKFLEQGGRCATPAREDRPPVFEKSPSDCSFFSTNPSSEYDETFIYEIPVVFHVIQSTGGSGFIPMSQIQNQIDVLNEDFRALPGSFGGAGFDTFIQFKLADEDPGGNPTSGVTYSTNNNWYNDNGTYWNALNWDTDRYLNIYTNTAGGALGYVPNLPQGGIAGSNSDRVVVLWSTVGKNAPFGFPFNQGRTVTHEVGHYLGLEHTFAGGCSGGSCYSNGDLICDTNPESSPNSGCGPGSSSCGSTDPVRNYMNYSNDSCMNNFTAEQSKRMRCTIEFYRPQVAEVIIVDPPDPVECENSASVAWRNGGINPDVYTASLPLIGQTLTCTVNTSPSGHVLAGVFGYSAPANVPLGFTGQQILAAPGPIPGELLKQPLLPGPTAVFEIDIPNDGSLCGLVIYSQAVLAGGNPVIGVSNAQDLTVGM